MSQEAEPKVQEELNLPPLLLKPLRFKIAFGGAFSAFVSVGLVVIFACYVMALGKSCVMDMRFHWISLIACAFVVVYAFSTPLITNILSGRIVRAWLYMLWLGLTISMVDYTLNVIKMTIIAKSVIKPEVLVFLFALYLANQYQRLHFLLCLIFQILDFLMIHNNFQKLLHIPKIHYYRLIF